MKEKKKYLKKAGKNKPGNKTETMLSNLGEIVGITKTEIQSMFNTKRNRLVNYMILFTLASFTSLSYFTYLSLHYRGSSVQDFEMVERVMRGFFGRFY
jgi:hypothetical protein